MGEYMEYKGYVGVITGHDKDGYYGTIDNVEHPNTFTSKTKNGINSAFHKAVDKIIERESDKDG